MIIIAQPLRRIVFLRKGCSCLPERLFSSKIVVRASPNTCFPQKWLFVHPRTFVFLKNGCSCTPERLFFSKTVVRAPPNVCFSQKRLFQSLGTFVFLKNGCSNPLERLFFSKMIVPTPWNVCFPQNWLFQPLGTAVWAALKQKKSMSQRACSLGICYQRMCAVVYSLTSFIPSSTACMLRGMRP